MPLVSSELGAGAGAAALPLVSSELGAAARAAVVLDGAFAVGVVTGDGPADTPATPATPESAYG